MAPLDPGSPSGGLTLSMSVSVQVTDGQGGKYLLTTVGRN